MITIKVRWRAIFEPICWVRKHIVKTSVGLHASDGNWYFCERCARTRRTWKIVNVIRYGYSYRYLVSVDWHGREIGRTLQATNDPDPRAFDE